MKKTTTERYYYSKLSHELMLRVLDDRGLLGKHRPLHPTERQLVRWAQELREYGEERKQYQSNEFWIALAMQYYLKVDQFEIAPPFYSEKCTIPQFYEKEYTYHAKKQKPTPLSVSILVNRLVAGVATKKTTTAK